MKKKDIWKRSDIQLQYFLINFYSSSLNLPSMKLHCRNFILCEFALSNGSLEILTLAETLGSKKTCSLIFQIWQIFLLISIINLLYWPYFHFFFKFDRLSKNVNFSRLCYFVFFVFVWLNFFRSINSLCKRLTFTICQSCR